MSQAGACLQPAGLGAENHKLRQVHPRRVPVPDDPQEHLRRALLDLQEAHRRFVADYGRTESAEAAAREADDARAQAARWGALARASARLADDE